MSISTDHLAHCIRTLESSLTLYRQAEPESINQEVFKNAIVKGYELAQETSFKLLKRVLKDFGRGGLCVDRVVDGAGMIEEAFNPPHKGTYTPRQYRGKPYACLILAMKRAYGRQQ